MRDVYVAGIGITTFTRLEYALSEIASYASMMALKDAGVTGSTMSTWPTWAGPG